MVEELKLAIKIDDASIEQSLLKQFANAQKTADKVVLDFKNVNFDDKQIEAKFKEMQKKAGQNPIDLTIGGNTFDMLGQIDKRLTEIFSIGKGKSFIDSSSTVSEINKITQATKELNKAQTGSENIQSKSFTTKNKTEAYNQLKQVADVFKKFYGNEEAMHTKAGTEAAYAYYKAYEEALRKGVAESKLQKVTVDVDKDGFFNAERISSTRIKEFANFEKYGGEVTALSEEISYFEKRLLKFSEAYSQIQSKLGKAPITPEIIQNIEEYVRNLEIAEARTKDADLMGFTKEDIDLYKDSANMYLGFATEDAIRENEKYISSLKEVKKEKENVDASLSKSQISDMDSSLVDQQNKIQEELKETQKQAEQTSESLSKIGDGQKTNISSGRKDAFPDSSTDTKPEIQGMDQVEKANEEAVQAKKDFATANEGVQSSINGSENPLKLEAELMEQIAKSAREAADAKKEFVEANKQVKDSANDSNNDLAGGHSENAEPSGVKKYKKKGYKAHDTGNHDNEKKVSNKAELEQALRELQSEIIASIEESTSFVKEITDFYDSQDNLVKTQTKVGDKNGSMRTYTHSYSTDKDGNTTAWTSHIETQKYQDQNKIIQEQTKNLQKLSTEKQKAAESERKSTVNQASKDQLEAWKQIQRIRKEIAGTSNDKLIEQLEQEKKTYQEQYLAATKILKNNSDLYNSEQRLNELKKISLKTTQQIESSQQRQFNGYDNKLSGYQGKVSEYSATINKFGNDGWTSPEYLEKVQEARKALSLYQEAINELKANPDLINKESLANVERLGKDFEDVAFDIKNMTAAQKGYTQLGAEKALDKISQMVKENSKMSRQAKADIKAWYDQIASGNPSASLDVILGKVEEIVRKEKEAGRGGKSMWDAIKEKAWYGAANAIGTYFGVNDIFRYVQQGIGIVRELNTALTEMRKVSDESIQTLKDYQKESFNTADAVGTTAKQIQTSTADYMRLGESLDKAAESAKTANVLMNVSEFDNIEDATKSLVAMGQAYKDLDKMTIVDKLNEVGKIVAQTYSNVWCYKNIAW